MLQFIYQIQLTLVLNISLSQNHALATPNLLKNPIQRSPRPHSLLRSSHVLPISRPWEAAVLKFKASGCSKETSPIPWFLDGRVKKNPSQTNGRDVWFTLSGLGKFILSKTNSWPLQISGSRMTFPFGARRASPDVPSSSGILVEKQLHKLASFFCPSHSCHLTITNSYFLACKRKPGWKSKSKSIP